MKTKLAPGGEDNTPCNSHRGLRCLQEHHGQFLDRGFHGEESRTNGNCRGGGAKEMPTSCCMCEPLETAQSLGDDTHAVVSRPKSASEHGLHIGVQSALSVGGLTARCSNKLAGGRERRTWTVVNEQERRENCTRNDHLGTNMVTDTGLGSRMNEYL